MNNYIVIPRKFGFLVIRSNTDHVVFCTMLLSLKYFVINYDLLI